MPRVVTANDLATGAVLFLSADGGWVTRFDQAVEYADANAAETGLALAREDVRRNRIVDPFVTEKGLDGAGAPRMMTLRDRIRADGPTIDYGTGHRAGA